MVAHFPPEPGSPASPDGPRRPLRHRPRLAIGSRDAGLLPTVGGRRLPPANHHRGGRGRGARAEDGGRRRGQAAQRGAGGARAAVARLPGAAPEGSRAVTAAVSRRLRRGRWTGGAGSRRVRPGPRGGWGRAGKLGRSRGGARRGPRPGRIRPRALRARRGPHRGVQARGPRAVPTPPGQPP